MEQHKKSRKLSILPVLKVFFKHTARYKLVALLSLFFVLIISALQIITPIFYKKLFDLIASTTPTPEATTALVSVLITITTIYFASWAIRRIAQLANIYMQARIMNDLNQSSFNYLLGHSYTFFVNNFAGSLVRKINRLARAYEQFMDRLTFDLLPLFVSLVGILIVLFIRNTWLGLAFLIWVVVLMTIQFLIATWKLKWNIALAEKDSENTAVLSDSISNSITVKTFTGKQTESNTLGKVSDALMNLRLKSWRLDEMVNAIQGLLMIGIEFVLIYLSIKFWSQGLITIGDFALIQAYLISATERLWNFGHIIRQMYEAFADATEMVEILDLPHEVKDKPTANELKVSEGKLQFKNVSFNFRQTRKILENFNLEVGAKEKIALVGPSGAGKTTITKLLFRFYDVLDGEILVDGQNIADATQDSLRRSIAMVPQEPILFHRTLMENIRYGRIEATDAEVIEAAKQAHCYEFINHLADGFNTYVGERGIKLSGGERQRVAIARAILKNAPILVLDEATSSLDSESESLIQDALAKLMQGKTVIVIAHRLSTIMKMDRIVVVQDGKVATAGTHDELIKQENGLYKKLWEIQAGGFMK